MSRPASEITGLLVDWNNGDQSALDRLLPLVEKELHRLAHSYMRRENPNHTLQTTALVNEAYLKLIRGHDIHCESRVQFFALCAQVIRHILVDHARSGRYAKRGGGVAQVPLDEEIHGKPAPGVGVLALHEALLSLSKVDVRKGRVVEMRYFAGLSVEETAEALQISPETAKRDWKIAKAWLLRELSGREGTVRASNDCSSAHAFQLNKPTG